jgi:AcrR family transcriptional regulator
MTRGKPKRTGLIESAAQLFHKRGYADVSLQDIAAAAGMRQGNVYYYFKSKSDLAAAVLMYWRDLAGAAFTTLKAKKDAHLRVAAFLKQSSEMAEVYTEWGCPIAGLSDDLIAALPAKQRDAMPRVYATHLAFLSSAFKDMGLDEAQSRKESYLLLAGLQGAIHLSHVMSDSSILRDFIAAKIRQVKQLNA